MKTFWIILIIIAVIGFSVYAYGKKLISKLIFSNPQLVGADLKSIFSGSGFTTIDLTETIINNNTFNISVDRLYVEVYYQGQTIGKSTSVHPKFIIPAQGNIVITQNLTLALNSTLGIATQLIAGQTVTFTYMIRALLFGFFPFTYKGTFTY